MTEGNTDVAASTTISDTTLFDIELLTFTLSILSEIVSTISSSLLFCTLILFRQAMTVLKGELSARTGEGDVGGLDVVDFATLGRPGPRPLVGTEVGVVAVSLSLL